MKKLRNIWYQIISESCLLLAVLCILTAGETARAIPCSAAERTAEELSDGNYRPTSFEWSGGSGKVTITCPEFEIRDGEAEAELVFSSEHYTYVKLDGITYYGTSGDGTSVFQIPVRLNEEMEITAQTTAMSTPHEITYYICVGYDERVSSDGEFPEAKSGADADSEGRGLTGGKADSTVQELNGEDAASSDQEADGTDRTLKAVSEREIPGLIYESSMELQYADQFAVDYYEGGYKLLTVADGRAYLLVPEGAEIPSALDEDITVLQQPISKIYLAASSSMSLFDALDALDAISLSSIQASGWYVENAKKAMEEGEILFAGKYSEPDYELLIQNNCGLAIESTMILHSPKVQEQLESIGIPVFIERSSYETHPLGRTEWIKLYGAMLDLEEEADDFFKEQAEVIDRLQGFENTGKTIAFFYLSSDGTVVCRSGNDYIAKMIEIAGGRYAFPEIGLDSVTSSVSLTMEEFYAGAVDADYLIYNAAIDDPLETCDELIAKNSLFADFKAVKEGNVWSTGKSLYQASDTVGTLITDLNNMLVGRESEMTFIHKLS